MQQSTGIALRYGEHIAPPEGTIEAHRSVLNELGYVWYGKFGPPLAVGTMGKSRRPMPEFALLLRSGRGKGDKIHLATVADVLRDLPGSEIGAVPAYYRDRMSVVGAWLRVTGLAPVDPEEFLKVTVGSSRMKLIDTMRESMSPIFYVTYEGEWSKLAGPNAH